MSRPPRGLRPTHAVDHALLVLAPVVTLLALRHFLSLHVLAVDFRDAYWWAGHQVLHGLSPYHPSAARTATGIVFVYPPLAALGFAPLALLPAGVAGALFTLICLACLGLALHVAGVRDWRVYAAIVMWSPAVTAWQAANLTLPLALGLALVWRHRDRPIVAGAICALVVSLKPFLWPLGLWLLATRRYAVTAWAAAIGIVVNLVAWSVIGFDQLSAFLRANDAVIAVLRGMGYGVESVGATLGLGSAPAEVLMVVLSAAAALACVIAGRRRRDRAAFTGCVGLMLLASPIVDFHYFALLAVPLALARPRLHPLWLVPLLLWFCPPMRFAGLTALLWWAAAGLILLDAAGGLDVLTRAGRGLRVSAVAPATLGILERRP